MSRSARRRVTRAMARRATEPERWRWWETTRREHHPGRRTRYYRDGELWYAEVFDGTGHLFYWLAGAPEH